MDRPQRLIQLQAKAPKASDGWGNGPCNPPKSWSTAAGEDTKPALWTCKACSKTMQLFLQASHVSSEEHISRCNQLKTYRATRPTTNYQETAQSRVDSARGEDIQFHGTWLSTEAPIEKTYCDICRQDYRESKKGPHLTPGWYCEVCDHYMHIISKESHLGGKKHAAEVASQRQRGSGWEAS